jgi:acetylornithine deacetylase/succinyl-diaminopimelate desuccinylase-like protein
MNLIERIAQKAQVQAALNDLAAQMEQIVATAVSIQQIPAPTFAEAERAAFIESQFQAVGLVDVGHDDLWNVYGRYPAHTPTQPPVIISAHSDTVFPIDTDLTTKRRDKIVYGPGLGDNSTGVAGLLHLAQTYLAHNLPTTADLWFVANVSEEGLGDLRGMRAVVERFGQDAIYIVIEGGLFGQISHQAIGVRRYRIEVTTGGGHSWGNFGQKSAIHELAHLITAIDRLNMPEFPKTTFNVGVIEGGTSINTIAASARFLLDLRSAQPEVLDELVTAVSQIVDAARNRLPDNGDCAITMAEIGNRPAGSIPRSHPLVQWAEDALRYVGCQQITYIAGSTDANIPLSQGLTAVCVGLTQSGNAHRLDEFIDTTHLVHGMQQILLLSLAAAGAL